MTTLSILEEFKRRRIIPALEGDQLKLAGDTENLPEELMQEIKAVKNELIEFLRASAAQISRTIIPPVPEQKSYPVSNAQKRIWILSQFEGGAMAYNIVTGFYLKGNVNHKRLNYAFLQSIQRHESLRTIFKETGFELRQHIKKQLPFQIEAEDISGAEDRRNGIRSALEKAYAYGFDIEKGPLIKVKLLRISPEEYIMLLSLHHIISDGWSVAILIKEVLHFYEASGTIAARPPKPLKIQYRDYSDWLAGRIESSKGQKAKDFWSSQFETPYDPLSLFTDFVRPAERSFDGAHCKFYPGSDLYNRVLEFCRRCQTTPFNFFRAALTILLNKFSGQNDITIGSPVSGRNHVELENQIGLYVNTLPLRIEIDLKDEFVFFLRKITQHSAQAFEFHEYPLDKIVENSKIKWNTGRNPLFDVLLVLQDTATEGAEISQTKRPDFELSLLDGYLSEPSGQEQKNIFSKFDLSFSFSGGNGGNFSLDIEYPLSLFRKESISLIYHAYLNIIEQVLSRPQIVLSDIETVNQQEKHRLLNEFNDTITPYSADRTVLDLFEEQVMKKPDTTAMVFEGNELTYQELNRKANQLGLYLREQCLVRANDLIGIQLDRSEWLIIAILGILKSGGAYVPIDPEYPEERIAYIVADSRCKMVIDQRQLEKFKLRRDEFPDSDIAHVNKPSDLLYVIYTSGSTGKPKGCMLENRGVVNRLEWMWQHYGFGPDDIILQKTTFTFDVSVWEIFMPLCRGAKMVLCQKEDTQSPARMLSLIERQQITCLHFVPGMLQPFITDLWGTQGVKDRMKSLRRVITSGEALSPKTVSDWYGKVDIPLHNLYGPTEASVDVTYYATTAQDTRIPIGRPIWNTQLYILDASDQLVPIGMTGAICIAGDGLARGYLNNPVLTSERFVANPFKENQRMYRTGDIGRWLHDGNIEFIGRKDDQVKIRGYRIELGEIENALELHPAIISAAVLARAKPSGEKELHAYIVCQSSMPASDAREHLSRILPAYMMPSYFVRLDKLPLTSSGKIDRKALPEQDGTDLPTAIQYEAPRHAVEEKLAAIWEEILANENNPVNGQGTKNRIGINDDFLHLGGHSLNVIRLASRIYEIFEVKVTLKDLFARTVLKDQAQLIEGSEKIAFTRIAPVDNAASYALSPSQRRLWVLSQFGEGNIAYNMAGAYRIDGIPDINVLEYTFRTLIQRHESLRTIFKEDEQGEIRQFILPETTGFAITYKDLSQEQEAEEKVRDWVNRELLTPFELDRGPLIRACLLRIRENACIFTCAVHHIVSDGWSMEILTRELLLLYNARIKGDENPLPPLRIQYKDYVAWQRGLLSDGNLRAHRAYWLEQFEGELPAWEFPGDRPRPAVKTYSGGTICKRLSSLKSLRFKSLNQEQDATLFMGLLAAVNILLYRYTNQTDIIIGSPIAGREHADLENQVGLYANTLALRTRFKDGDSFYELLKVVKEVTLGAYLHHAYPLDELVSALHLHPDMSRNALFEIEVILQSTETGNIGQPKSLGTSKVNDYEDAGQLTSRFDLVFDFVEIGEEIQMGLTYNSDIYQKNTAERLLNHLEQLLETIIATPNRAISRLDYLDTAEKCQLLTVFNKTETAWPKDVTIVSLFEEQAKRIPDNTAVVLKGRHLTYREIDSKSNLLAYYLRITHAIRPNDLIAIMLDRSEFMVIAILGVLKSGGAYVPIDPGYPGSRKKFILQDTNAQILITQTDYIFDLDYYTGNTFAIDIQLEGADLPDVFQSAAPKPGDLAYVIYTSGSTGSPKGVMIQHSAIVNTILSQMAFFDMKEGERNLQFASPSFDASVSEIFVSMASGGTLYIIDEDRKKDPAWLQQYMTENKIDIATIPPVYLKLMEIDEIRTLKKLVTAGEAAIPGKAVAFLNHGTYYNAYGPTESSICATIFKVRQGGQIADADIPIGIPIANTYIYIVDDHLNLLPIGAIGEIFIGGAGLSNGYINNQDLTTEKFIPDPFREGGRVYKTGDLARWLPDGNIQFRGRKDGQVKIHGYRIELAEIEKILQDHPAIDAAIAIVRTSKEDERELVAYLVSPSALNIAELGAYLGKILPSFMLPSYYVQLDRLPVTSNGKVDRRALPDPEGSAMDTGTTYIPPRNLIEERLALIWKEILGRERIGAKDNFFDLGGHSLRATRLASQIYKEFDCKIELKDLFESPLLEEQAALIRQSPKTAFTAILPTAEQPGYVLSPSQRRVWLLSRTEKGNAAHNVPAAYILEGNLDLSALSYAFAAVIQRHEILRTTFREDEQGDIRQFIRPAEDRNFSILYQDLRIEDEQDEKVRTLVEKEFLQPFILDELPLLRTGLYQLEDNKWIFSYVMHHIISDGWSMGVLIKELLLLYHAHMEGTPAPLTPLKIQYKDYAAWQTAQLNGESLQAHKDYWMRQFEGEFPVLQWQDARPRPSMKTYNGKSVTRRIDAGLCKSIKDLSRQQGGTLFMGLLAAVNIVLYRHTDQKDIIIGSPIAGREHADLEDQIGFYVNTLAIRTRFRTTDNFRDIFGIVKENTLGAYRHQAYPFDELADALNCQWDNSRNPLFDVWVVLHNTEINNIEQQYIKGLKINRYEDGADLRLKFDLLFRFVEIGDFLEATIEYNTAILYKNTVENMSEQLEHILLHVTKDPEIKLSEIKKNLDDRDEIIHKDRLQKTRLKNLAKLKTK